MIRKCMSVDDKAVCCLTWNTFIIQRHDAQCELHGHQNGMIDCHCEWRNAIILRM